MYQYITAILVVLGITVGSFVGMAKGLQSTTKDVSTIYKSIHGSNQ